MTISMREYMPALMQEIDVTVWAPLTVTRVFRLSEFVNMYSYNDKLPVTFICNTMNLSLKVLHFFPAVYFAKFVKMNFSASHHQLFSVIRHMKYEICKEQQK